MRGPASGAPCAACLLLLTVLVTNLFFVLADARTSKQQLVVCQSSDKVCSSWPQLDHKLRHRLLSSGHVCGHALTDPLRAIEGLDNFIPIRTASGELQYLQCNSVQYRFRRQASGYGPRGKYRGQTQSQYLSIDQGSGVDDGKAEAHSAADSSHATVSGKSGMGQAQSQSIYDPSCDDCIGRSDTGVENLQRHPGQPGSGQFGGREETQEGIGAPGSRPNIGSGAPGWNGYPAGRTPVSGTVYSQGGPGRGLPGIPGGQGLHDQYPSAAEHGQSYPGGQGTYTGRTGQGQQGLFPGGTGQSQPGQYPGGTVQRQPGTLPGATGQGQPGKYPSGTGQYPGQDGNSQPGFYHDGTGQGKPEQYPIGTGLSQPGQYPGGTGQPSQYPGGTGQPEHYPGGTGQPGHYPGVTGQIIPKQYPVGTGQGTPGHYPGKPGQGTSGQYPGGTIQSVPGQYTGEIGQDTSGQHPGGTGQGAPGQYQGERGQGTLGQYPGGSGQGVPGQNQGGTGQSTPRLYPGKIIQDHPGTFQGGFGPNLLGGGPHGPPGQSQPGRLPGGTGSEPRQMILPNPGYNHINQGSGGGLLPGSTEGGKGPGGYHNSGVPYGSGTPQGAGPQGGQNIPNAPKGTINGPDGGQQPIGPGGTIFPGREGQVIRPTGPISSGSSNYKPGSGQPGTNQYGLQPGKKPYESPVIDQFGSQNSRSGLIPYGQGNSPHGALPGSLVGTHIGPNGEIIYCCIVSQGQGNAGQPGSLTTSDLSRPGYVQPGGSISSGGKLPYGSETPGRPTSYGPGSEDGGQQNYGQQPTSIQQTNIPGGSQAYTPGSQFPGMQNVGQEYLPGSGRWTIGVQTPADVGTINRESGPFYPGESKQWYGPGQENIQGLPGVHPGYTQAKPNGPNISQASPGYQYGGGPSAEASGTSTGLLPDAGVSTNRQPYQYSQGPTGPQDSDSVAGPIRQGFSGTAPGSQTGHPDQYAIPGQQINGQAGPQGSEGYPNQALPGGIHTQNTYPGSYNQANFPGQTGYHGQITQGGYPSGSNYPGQGRLSGQTGFPGEGHQIGGPNTSGFPGSTYQDGLQHQTGYPGQTGQMIPGQTGQTIPGESGYPGQMGHGDHLTGFTGPTPPGSVPGQIGFPGQITQGGGPVQSGLPGELPSQGGVQPGVPGTIYIQGGRGPSGTSNGGTPGYNEPYNGGNWAPGGPQAIGGGPSTIDGYGQLPYGGQPGHTPGAGVPGGQTGYPGSSSTSSNLNGIPQNVIDPNSISPSLDDDSDALASVTQDKNGTIASASSKGGNAKGRAQTQVQGTYTGSGTFSAQAQISDETKGAESQVSGGKQGASSSASGRGRNNKSQANVQLGSETGSLQTQAQSEGSSHSSNTQVQGSVKGGMADAQARGPGSTSSQAQIGFTPYKEGDKSHDVLKTPFVGGGTASSQSTGRIGQSQSQLQGTFKYGISYNGAAQAGSSVDREAVFPNRIPFNKIDVFDENNKNINVNPETTSSSTTAPEVSSRSNILNDNKATWDDIDSHTHYEHHKNEQPIKGNTNTPTPVGGRKSFRPASSFDYNAEKEDIPEDYADDYEPEGNDEPYEPDEAILETMDDPPNLQSTSRKSLDIKQTIGGNTQHIVLGPLHNKDAEIIQKNSERPDLEKVYQPGEKVPGTGFTIPLGFTGSVKAVSSRDNTYAVGSDASPSQAQTVALRPGSGKVNYIYPSGAATTSYGKNVNSENLRSLSNSKGSSNYLSVSKSVTGALDGDNKIKKQYAHTYYTKSSSCGYFTFTCTVVTGSNGRKKVCKPKIPTNPDGTPMKC